MNCVSCGAPLKYDGAKFCTKCGAKQPAANTAAQQAAQQAATAPQPENAVRQNSEKQIGMVKKYMYWNIKPGEIARRINEAEFLIYENARGIVVNDGTTAYIRSNGETLTVLQGGTYDFVSEEEINRILNTQYGGAAQGLGKAWKWLVSLVAGRRVSDNIEEEEQPDYDKMRSLDDVIRHAQGNNLFSIVLKQDREFQLVFGETHDSADDFAELVPMTIRTKYHDAKMGVRAFFAIDDFESFAAHYLSDTPSATTSRLAKLLTPLIRNTVQQVMADVEMTDTRVSAEHLRQIESRLRTINFHGITLRSIVEISADNEDLERMHQLARELYLSEQELTQLQRTNDFKNRLNTVENQQRLAEARDEVDLFRRLQEINKDGALEMEELRKFYIVLTREQRIYDAQSALTESQQMLDIQRANDDIAKALSEMEATGLLRQEEIAILRDEINQRTYKRGYAFAMMQQKDAIELAKVQQGGEFDLQMQQKMAQIALQRADDDLYVERRSRGREQQHADFVQEREHARMVQDDANRQAEFEQNLQQRNLEQAMQMQQRMQQAQMESIRQMADIDREKQAQHDDHEMRMQQSAADHEYRMQHDRLEQEAAIHRDSQDTIRQRQEQEAAMHRDSQETLRQRMDHLSNMSADQLNAEAVSRAMMENWSSEERVAYAQAQATQNKKSEEERDKREQMMEEKNRQMLQQQQRHAEMMQQNAQATMETMERMFNRMSDNSTATSIQMMQERTAQKEEYRDELHRQQQRLDTNQDQALNYTTRQNIGTRAQVIVQPAPQQPTAQNSQSTQPSQTSQSSQSSQPQAKAAKAAEAVKRCPQCGREYLADDNFCPECGIVI